MPVIESGLTAHVPADTAIVGWHNLVTTTNVDTTTEADGYPASNLANPATHLLWVGGTNTGDELITITLSTTELIDYVAVAKHNWGTESFLVSVEISSNDSPSDFITVISPQTVASDLPIIFRFEPQAVGSIRIRLAVTTGTVDVPQAAVVYVGSLLDLTRGVRVDQEHVPVTYGRRTTVINGMSESGNFLGRLVLGEHRYTKAEFFGFEKTFYDSDIDPFLAAAQERPFFFAYAPTEYPAEVGYVWLVNNAEPEIRPDTSVRAVALTLEMRGIA